jgi:hypothetical protein
MYTNGQAGGSLQAIGTTTIDGKKQLPIGLRRYPLAEYISQHYGGKYIFISDECHKAKGGSTQVGMAMQDLLSGARRSLMMTGTLYGGKASTIFYLLYRASQSFRTMYDYDEESRFVQHYGLHKIITRRKKRRNTYRGGYSYDDPEVIIKEAPGCHPGIVALLLPQTAFLRLEDLNIALPPKSEAVLPVEMPDDMKKVYTGPLGDLYELGRKKAACGNMGILSAWMQAAMGWLDCPVQETITVTYGEEGSEVTETFELPDLSHLQLPKVEAICDQIEQQFKQYHRKSLVFFEQVNRRDPIPFFEKALKARGLKPWVLRSSTKAEDREDLYKQAIVQGYNVFLMNGSLVEMGMDMVEAPELHRTQINFSVYKVDQQNGRNYRIGQDQPVRRVYSYYSNTIQQVATFMLADKLAATATFDGEVSEGLAAMSQNADSLQSQLLKAVAGDAVVNMPKTLTVIRKDSDMTQWSEAHALYQSLKSLYPDHVAMLRIDDFYETFDADAELIARELDLILTSRPISDGMRSPLACWPVKSSESYVERLLNKGYKVALGHQHEATQTYEPVAFKKELTGDEAAEFLASIPTFGLDRVPDEHPIVGQTYVLTHRMGLIEVRNGHVLGHLTWMGGGVLVGPDNLKAIASKVNLAKMKTGKPWSVEVVWA